MKGEESMTESTNLIEPIINQTEIQNGEIGIISNQNGKMYEKVVYNFLVGKTNKTNKKGYPIRRKRFTHSQIVERGESSNQDIHSKDDSDLDIPHLGIQIEVKGTKIKYNRGNRKLENLEKKQQDGKFRFTKTNFAKRINCYGFVFGISKKFIVFLTKKEIIEAIGQKRYRAVLSGNKKKLYVKQQDILKKGLFEYKDYLFAF